MCDECNRLENVVYRLERRIEELHESLRKAEDKAGRVPFLEKEIKGFEDARARSAIPEPGPTDRDLGYEAGLERAIDVIESMDFSPNNILPVSECLIACADALRDALDTPECDAPKKTR